MGILRAIVVMAALFPPLCLSALAGDPPLASGKDPEGVAVAVVADGFDYTRADLAKILARDGEGEAIALDTVDNDHRPFAKEGSGTQIGLAAASQTGIRLVMARVDWANADSLARSLQFVTFTPARIVLAPLAAEHRGQLALIASAAKAFASVLFVTSVPSITLEDMEKTEGIANLVVLNAAEKPFAAADAVALAFGCGRGAIAGTTGAEMKGLLLARLKEKSAVTCEPEGSDERE